MPILIKYFISLSSSVAFANASRNFTRSVNLGGWFVLEPFIAPALYQKYPGAVDEWTLSENMRSDTAGGGISQLEDHYKTFIVSFFSILIPKRRD